MSKGSNRRRENTAAVEANWDRIFSGRGRVAEPQEQPTAYVEEASNEEQRQAVGPNE